MTSIRRSPPPSLLSYGMDLNHIFEQTATSLGLQCPLSTSPNSQQVTQTDANDDFLAMLDDERTKQPIMNMEIEKWMSYLKDMPEFTDSPQSIGIDPNTSSSNGPMHCHQDICPSGGKLPTTPKPIDKAILAQTILEEQDFHFTYPMARDQPDICQSPILRAPSPQEIPNSSQCELFTAPVLTQNPCEAFVKFNYIESKVIQILAEPRAKYRPRTQNESRTSAHYLRCDDDADYDHPTISLPQFWTQQSDTNYIELTLVDTAKQPHPYLLRNKTSQPSFKNREFIVQQNDKNILYYPLTNDDFLTGYKTLMVELIKCKQDDTITKKLITQRQLDQSMLRFTRIYVDKQGRSQRDKESVAYSSIMTENYGEVCVEHMGPRYGAMHEKETMFIILKGRVVKEALQIVVSEQATRRSYTVSNVTLNGTVAYFLMPAYPCSQNDRVTVNICVYYREVLLQQATYTYLNIINENGIVDDVATTIPRNIQRLPMVFKKASKNTQPKRLITRRKLC